MGWVSGWKRTYQDGWQKNKYVKQWMKEMKVKWQRKSAIRFFSLSLDSCCLVFLCFPFSLFTASERIVNLIEYLIDSKIALKFHRGSFFRAQSLPSSSRS
jgi:hypothetical protein